MIPKEPIEEIAYEKITMSKEDKILLTEELIQLMEKLRDGIKESSIGDTADG